MSAILNLNPQEFENHVRDWLVASSERMADFAVTRLEHIPGAGGEYEIDVIVRFRLFGGAEFVVLVECKHHRHPIKRDVVMVLESKLRDTKAHKGMIFSTTDFQSGALKFAKVHGIATLRVAEAGTAYLTKSFGPAFDASAGASAVAWMCTPSKGGCNMELATGVNGGALRQWLESGK